VPPALLMLAAFTAERMWTRLVMGLMLGSAKPDEKKIYRFRRTVANNACIRFLWALQFIHRNTLRGMKMTANQIYKKMIATAAALPVSELKIQIAKFMNDTTDGATTIFSALLDALEGKVSESEFVEFCESL
jgi:hypothetical protein